MTARLGSEYRYFGKLVLVPFRYFSIDTYRNIDIFDNTSAPITDILNRYVSGVKMNAKINNNKSSDKKNSLNAFKHVFNSENC